MLPDEVSKSDFQAIEKWRPGGLIFLGNLRDWWRENEPDDELLPPVQEIFDREGDPADS